MTEMIQDASYDTSLAIVGMSGRFPGANDVETLWQNITQGIESIQRFSEHDLLEAGERLELLRNANYVKAGTTVQDIALFDAAFFGFTPREAEVMDPQHRLFLECAWEALERAGYVPDSYAGLIGVFAGSGFPTYMLNNISVNADLMETLGKLQVAVGNERDSLASMVSYKMNLRGPSIAVQTFCSTSLVATHLACQSLLNYECDIALAGGVAITIPQERGYLYEEGGILSPDGYCRTFDAQAQGSVMGNGLGVVAIKRLRDAVENGDYIYATILGSAVNNDGSVRVGYTAPGLEGQSDVISEALSHAGISAESISYIETHGTATKLGDAIELAAMIKAFTAETQQRQFCAIGSVKPNIGHLDRASGVTGLIKTCMALQHKLLPPSLNFKQTSSDIDLTNSPFYVNTKLQEWKRSSTIPLRAGVSSFGLGGTNTHVVLEEAPLREAGSPVRSWFILPLAARSQNALQQMALLLAEHLEKHPDLLLADVAYTLQVGRTAFNHRRILVCSSREDAIAQLRTTTNGTDDDQYVHQTISNCRIALLFPGEGEQYVGLAHELYEHEPLFRESLDLCFDILLRQHDLDLRTALYSTTAVVQPSSDLLNDPILAQTSTFIIEYALGRLFFSWGIQPQAMLGYSLGEYVAATLAGVLSLQDALHLVTERARLIASLPSSSMLAVPCSAEEMKEKLESLKPALRALVEQLEVHEPQLAYLSNVTGEWINAAQVQDPEYWGQHMCATVRFEKGVEQIVKEEEWVILEVGAGQTLSSLVKLLAGWSRERQKRVIASLPAVYEQQQDAQAAVLLAVGRLWANGVAIDWQKMVVGERRLRLPLPTYPFEKKRYWLEAPHEQASIALAQSSSKKVDIADWFYVPVWKQAALKTTDQQVLATQRLYLVFVDEYGIGAQVVARLEQMGAYVLQVLPGEHFAALTQQRFTLSSTQPTDYIQLFEHLANQRILPQHIIHCWSVTEATTTSSTTFHTIQDRSFYSLLFLSQALTHRFSEQIRLTIVSNNMQSITGQEQLIPEKSTLLGICKVVSQENPEITCRNIDLEEVAISSQDLNSLMAEIFATTAERLVAYRSQQRWTETFTARRLEAGQTTLLRSHGVYLITGGLGGVGTILARHLASEVKANLALVGRTALPPREDWADWLASHGKGDETSHKILNIQEIEQAGAKVLIIQADVADPIQMRNAIAYVQRTFGALHGVIHAAGISDRAAFGAVQDVKIDQCEWHFQPKVYGTYALAEAVQDLHLDFCMLFSSLSAILGGLGFTAYTAANCFMDAFVQHYNRTALSPWTCVNWDSWQVKENAHGDLGATIAEFTMSPAEGIEAFTRCLSSRCSRLVNSTGDLHARIRQWIMLETLQKTENVVISSTHISAHGEVKTSTPVHSNLTTGDYERILKEIWQQVLGIEQIEIYDNFFDLGGNSLIALQVVSKIRKVLQIQIPVVALFEAPSITAMVKYLQPQVETLVPQQSMLEQRRLQTRQRVASQEIAIIGMAGRFPGANTLEQFWQNLRNGVESLTIFTDEELSASGLEPEIIQNPAYVRARPILNPEDVETFDAALFGYSPREAAISDPQHRLFMECAWEALEHAGYDAQRYDGLIGVFGGTNISTYAFAFIGNQQDTGAANDYQLVIGNDKDSLATEVSYKLNLRGPSLTVQTFCSTSLVATHLACQSLLNGESDIALAGGVSVRVPLKTGHLYQEGGMESPDGHCRTFDAQAKGSNFGDGTAIVVLKRLVDALEDGDTIHAIIKGSAINNDGSLKVSYTAPSVNGQAQVVMQALAHAGVPADSISYIEAHGTATELGDPIEVASLTKAFRTHTQRTGFCAIGSVKTNIGHLDRAAGVTGLIKTVLALKHREIPANLHFTAPNPEIDFEQSPFIVNTKLTPWESHGEPRRAGVNSLGMGGTNAHVVVEESPLLAPSGPSRPYQLLLLSARTETALDAATANLRNYLQEHPAVPLADVAYTLQVGRKQMEMRRVVLCQTHEEAIARLAAEPRPFQLTSAEKRTDRPVAMLFPGIGEQYVGLAHELYEHEPLFRESLDLCFDILQRQHNLDLRTVLYSTSLSASSPVTAQPALNLRALLGREHAVSPDRLIDPVLAQTSTFIIEYALGRLFFTWGIQPQAMLGYSLGEYVAATLAGVFSLQDALHLVTERARLIASLPPSSMLAVSCSAEELKGLLASTQIDVAVESSPQSCVVSGSTEEITQLEEQLTLQGIASRRVETTHAFHSRQLEPLKPALRAVVEQLEVHEPQLAYLSNVTGEWISAAQVQDPEYWGQHMCATVRFEKGVEQIVKEEEWVILEVGAGQTLSSLVKLLAGCSRERQKRVIASLPSVHERQQDARVAVLLAVGRLWANGVAIDWQKLATGERRLRLPLPTYPFEKKRYWLETEKPRASKQPMKRLGVDQPEKIANLSDWFFLPSWKQSQPLPLFSGRGSQAQQVWLLFMDTCGVGHRLAELLKLHDQHVITIYAGQRYARHDETTFDIRPTEREDYDVLLRVLREQGRTPNSFAHLWMVTTAQDDGSVENTGEYLYQHGFSSLLPLAQAINDAGIDAVQIDVVTSEMQDVNGTENVVPEKALVTGPCKVIPQEYSQMRCRSIDIVLQGGAQEERLITHLLGELTSLTDDNVVALRGKYRWLQSFEAFKIEGEQSHHPPLRQGGTYLITGGLGGIGLAIAEYLVRSVKAQIVLVGRSALPARNEWEQVLQIQGSEHGVGRRIAQIRHLESLGACPLIVHADVTNEPQMRAVIDQTLAVFGALNGVIHAAAVPPSGLIQLKTPAMAANVLAPKVRGTVVIDRVTQDIPLDFLLLFSSMSSATGGGPGQADYCAANAFLDAFAHHHADKHGMTIAIDWGEWLWDAWEAGLEGFPPEIQTFFRERRQEYGISFEEGMEVINRVLMRRVPHIVISTQDFPTMVEGSKSYSITTIIEKLSDFRQAQPAYARPMLSTPYVAPENELEQVIASIWGELLGIDEIGIHDNFFELGGHSLIGTQLISRLRQAFQVNLALEIIFESSTIAEQAGIIGLTLIEEIEKTASAV